MEWILTGYNFEGNPGMAEDFRRLKPGESMKLAGYGEVKVVRIDKGKVLLVAIKEKPNRLTKVPRNA